MITGRTTIIISYDLTTVTDTDQVIYFDCGRVTEIGTHPRLLARNGADAHFYRTHQSRSAQTTTANSPARP